MEIGVIGLEKQGHLHAEILEGMAQAFTVDDSASTQLHTDDGFSVSMEVAWATNSPTVHEYYIRGTQAGAYLNLTDANRVAHHESPEVERLVLYPEGSTDGESQDDEIDIVPDPAYNRQFERFLDAIDGGEQPTINTIEDEFLASGAILILGGLGIILGIFPALGAFIVAGFLIIAGIIFHDFWAAPEDQQQTEMTQSLKNIALAGGALITAAVGPQTWAYSLNFTFL